MTHTQIALKVRDILADTLGLEPEQVTPAAALGEDLGADSLDRTELMMRFERDFSVAISDEEAAVCHTVQGCTMLVTAKIASKALAPPRPSDQGDGFASRLDT